MTIQLNVLMELSPIEKLELIQKLWDSLPEKPEGLYTHDPNFAEAIEAYAEGSSKYRNTLQQLSQLETDRLRKAIALGIKDSEEGRVETFTAEALDNLCEKIMREGRAEMGLEA